MGIRPHCAYLLRYGHYSGVSILCELFLFTLLFRRFDLPPFLANAFSAVASLALAWFISGRRLFMEKKITPAGHLIWYAYQFIAIGVYSFLVAWFIRMGIHYLVCKIGVLALSFALNSTFFRTVILKPRSESIK
ncbi:MAG: hypothetical protein LBM00_06705 [Deltaproteobacteria bacterium]|jgi:type IV secretory pathway VirB6-like protein|nr:hypothetical protein [Deltaproteobacteria bacterium]